MNNYLHIKFLGDNYCDVDVEYEVIDGDDSVGLSEDYEFIATCTNERGDEIDITDDLTRSETWEVIKAILQDMKKSEYDND